MTYSAKHVGKRDLAFRALDLEQNLLAENVGSQDQIAASFGGFNRIKFGGPAEFDIEPMTIPKENMKLLEDSVRLIYLGEPRIADDIESEKLKNLERNSNILTELHSLVDEAEQLLYGKSDSLIENISVLLRHQWELKKRPSYEL